MTIYKWIFPLKMVISHSYVSLPEGISGDSTQLEDSGPRAGPKGPKSRLSWLAVQEFFHHVSGEIKFTGSSWFTVVHHSISEFWMSEKSIKISPRTQIWCVCVTSTVFHEWLMELPCLTLLDTWITAWKKHRAYSKRLNAWTKSWRSHNWLAGSIRGKKGWKSFEPWNISLSVSHSIVLV